MRHNYRICQRKHNVQSVFEMFYSISDFHWQGLCHF